MESKDDIIDAAHERVASETSATLDFRTAKGNKAGSAIDTARDSREKLLPILHATEALHDLETILGVEKTFLTHEREHLAEAPLKTSSLDNGIQELEAALVMLKWVRRPDEYRKLDIFFSLSKNREHDLPRDQARQFFNSHSTRLKNLEKGRMEATEREIILARHSNIMLAQQLYIELQQSALAPDGIREPQPLYGVEKREPVCLQWQRQASAGDSHYALPGDDKKDQASLMGDLIDAIGRRDEETAVKLQAKIKWPAWGLKAGKELFGAGFIREQCFNTELADEKYGPDWLDREAV